MTKTRIAIVAALALPAAAMAAAWPTPLLTAITGTTALFQFMEGSGTTTLNEGLRPRDGRLVGYGDKWVEGLSGPALDFSMDGYIVIDPLNTDDAWTFQAFVQFPPIPVGKPFRALAGDGAETVHIGWLEEGYFAFRQGGEIRQTWNYLGDREQRWTLLTVVVEGESVRFYLDGEQVGYCDGRPYGPITQVGGDSVGDGGGHIDGGGAEDGGPEGFGVLDSFRFFKEVRNEEQINADVYSIPFAREDSAVACYLLDEGSGSIIANSVPLVATLNPATTWTAGIYGSAVNFGSSGAGMPLDTGGVMQDWTIQAWTRFPLPVTSNGRRTLASGSFQQHHITVNASGALGVYNSPTFIPCGGDVNSLSTGWHLVTVVGSADTTRIYVDDTSMGVAPWQCPLPVRMIGNSPMGSENWGVVDSLRILNVARTAEQVAADANPAPTRPNTLSQADARTGATVALGGSMHADLLVKGKSSDALGQALRLQVEVKPVGVDFDGTTGLFVGDAAASGALATTRVTGLHPGGHHWRVRALTPRNAPSTWLCFGTDPDNKNQVDVMAVNAAPVGGAAAQVRAADGTELAEGGRVGEREAVRFQAGAVDPDQDPLHLEVEVVLLGDGFRDQATVIGAEVAGGATLSCDVEPVPGRYEWQYRVVDSLGSGTAWTRFSGGGQGDFEVMPAGSMGPSSCLGSAPGCPALLPALMIVGGLLLKR